MQLAFQVKKKFIHYYSTKSQRLYIEKEPEELNYDPVK